ncbi:DUF2628 domain-containing protein [Aquabacter cavernae]|uniref:DUF2628 domain-containing protein n=1 Tax=Aquabacter cavernae TaxID=2496029 RepID=UPI000F8C6DFE|nr:DUF2628 domain-containing protein [Aquabacter cavernae]
MAIWNVLIKDRAGETEMGRAEGVAFVREQPFLLVFLFPLIALLRFRLWLALGLYLALSLALGLAGEWLRVPALAQGVAQIGMHLLLALELSSLRVWKLRRIGYLEAGLVAAPNREEAERRFFAHYVPPARRDLPPPRPLPSRPVGAAGVIGSFPEPRAS